MSEDFLYKTFDILSKTGGIIQDDLPKDIIDNLNPIFKLREYQEEAFRRFIYYNESYRNAERPIHLMYNMATGSGKTIIMAGLISYLYSQGYRNFLFFVNRDTIIQKTKDNFLNRNSSKYLFNDSLNFDGKNIRIREVRNFQGVSKNEINIRFDTINQLHLDLSTDKENSVTFEELRAEKIVLISDEAHHMQTATAQKQMEINSSWENTAQKILQQRPDNMLLEFTATMDFSDAEIISKYLNKVIYYYDLKEFRNDGYSKDVNILQSEASEKDRMLQAIILSQYRQEVASKHKINLKPVVLFKAQKTIDESHKNQEKFDKMIDELSESHIAKLRLRASEGLLKKVFTFFKNDSKLVKILKDNFSRTKCINVNNDADLKENQLKLNSLEDSSNQIRAIFAVQKLNEGWDVLNLFDIVRLYNTRDARKNNPGKTTISEAQLIGRGARYFPFKQSEIQEKYKRKFDNDLDNELRIIEELHYHSAKNSIYISELKQALRNEGMIDEMQFDLNIKDDIKKNKIYKSGAIYINAKVKNKNEQVMKFADLGIHFKNTEYNIYSGKSREISAFNKENDNFIPDEKDMKRSPVSIKEIYKNSHVVQNALARNSFFYFENLIQYFPNINSMREFILNKGYLGDLIIDFRGRATDLKHIKNFHYLDAMLLLLERVEKEAKANTMEFKGTTKFEPKFINEIFKDILISIDPTVPANKVKIDGQKDIIKNFEWYAYDANYGTSEEREIIEVLDKQVEKFKTRGYKDIYVFRNEKLFTIHNFSDGRGVSPDFVMFMNDKNKEPINYQFFIEAKGTHLMEHDKWKEEFLLSIKGQPNVIKLGRNKKHKLIGLPFFNSNMPNLFSQALDNSVP